MGETHFVACGGEALSCRRFEEVDFAAFLRDPQKAAFDAFREHYPGCADCAAEVRTWSDLLDGVGASSRDPLHPSAEELECFERAPAELAAQRCDFIAAHLQRCPSCAEELHILRGHNPEALRAIPAAESEPAWGKRLRAMPWSPALGFVLVGLLLFPLLYRSVGPDLAPAPLPKNQEALPDTAGEAAAESANRSPATLRPEERAPALASPAEPRAKLDRARRASRAPAAGEPDFSAPPDKTTPAQDALDAGFDSPNRPSLPVLTESLAEQVTPGVAPAPSLEAEHPHAGARDLDTNRARAARAPRKSEDPLAHHIWIPTMRLRPGQKSSGPASELRNGFFLEVPLPRDIPAGEAQVLIQPDGPLKRRDTHAAPEPLAAEDRALRALSRHAERADAATEPRSFEERVPVEAKQRALLLQVPPEVLLPGVYRVELEIRSEGEVRGRGRFRLELVAE